MTGPAKGKIELKGARIYIHLKGFARAQVTHIDVEHPLLNDIIKPNEATYFAGKEGGGFIGLKKEMMKRIEKLTKKCNKKV